MSNGSDKSETKVRKLLGQLEGKRSLLIVMQDNPDPDSIAAAAALRRIANNLGDVQCSITYGGVIGRAENRALANYLGLNFRPWAQVDPAKFETVALVDTQPGTGNNALPEEIPPDIVLDHHPLRPATRSVAFTDVRSKYGAVSTILYEYLCEAGITPDPPLATALLYAIRTDTQDLGSAAVKADIEAAEALLPLANKKMLSAIQRGAVSGDYFQKMAVALDNARVYGPCIVTRLGEVDHPDMMGEVADLLLRLEAVDWVLTSGVHDGKIWLSLRTAQSKQHAGELMRGIVDEIGTGGGHPTSAGGQVPLAKSSRAERDRFQKTIRERFLGGVGVPDERPSRLVQVGNG